jgi:hypothetical protein
MNLDSAPVTLPEHVAPHVSAGDNWTCMARCDGFSVGWRYPRRRSFIALTNASAADVHGVCDEKRRSSR